MCNAVCCPLCTPDSLLDAPSNTSLSVFDCNATCLTYKGGADHPPQITVQISHRFLKPLYTAMTDAQPVMSSATSSAADQASRISYLTACMPGAKAEMQSHFQGPTHVPMSIVFLLK